MAVRSVTFQQNCWLNRVKRVLNTSNTTADHLKTDVRRLHCCHACIGWRCLNDHRRYRRGVSIVVPLRHVVQNFNERVPNLPEEKAVTLKSQTDSNVEEKEEIVIDYNRGLPRITVPLPSRKEKCRFTLKPISNTVRDLSAMIKEEDRGIDRVVLYTKDGVKIASSSSIELLLDEETFYMVINDKNYKIKVPSTVRRSFNKEDIEKLSDVRSLISQLYESLNVKDYQVRTEKELLSKLEKIQVSLAPLEEQRKSLEKRAAFRTSILTWFGLGMMSVQFGILARLTWWEYSWDIMEPVTYFVTYGTAMATYAYFALTKQDYILPDIRDRQHLITLHKKARKAGFDMNQYNTLKEELASVTTDLENLRDNGVSKISKAYSLNKYGDLTKDFTRPNSVLDIVKEYYTFILNKTKKS